MMDLSDQQSSIAMFCQTAAEILLHAVAETTGMNHEDSTLAETLLAPASSSPVSQSIKNRLLLTNESSKEARSVAQFSEEQALRYLTLGYNPEIDWERLPEFIRHLLVERCSGQRGKLTKSQEDWLLFDKAHGLPVKTFMARCDFGVYVAMANQRYAVGSRVDFPAQTLYHESKHATLLISSPNGINHEWCQH
jgi:hypothetical protein